MKTNIICAFSRTLILLIVVIFIPLIVMFSCQEHSPADPVETPAVDSSLDTLQSVENGNYPDTIR